MCKCLLVIKTVKYIKSLFKYDLWLASKNFRMKKIWLRKFLERILANNLISFSKPPLWCYRHTNKSSSKWLQKNVHKVIKYLLKSACRDSKSRTVNFLLLPLDESRVTQIHRATISSLFSIKIIYSLTK